MFPDVYSPVTGPGERHQDQGRARIRAQKPGAGASRQAGFVAAIGRTAALALNSRLVGEFATSGTYRIPGAFDRRDDHLVAVSSGERIIVLTPEQDREATPLIAPYLKKARVLGFAEGGTFGGAGGRQQAAGSSDSPIEVNLTLLVSHALTVGPAEAAEILVQALDTDTGRRANVKLVNKALVDGEIDPNRRRR